jgi:hypothetical protein
MQYASESRDYVGRVPALLHALRKMTFLLQVIASTFWTTIAK